MRKKRKKWDGEEKGLGLGRTEWEDWRIIFSKML